MALVRPQQRQWVRQLSARFGDECVIEWAAFDRQVDRYCPHLDIAIGPFAVESGTRRTSDYERLAHGHRAFLEELWAGHEHNEAHFNAHDQQCALSLDHALEQNRNARCFLAIEIENQVSRKHLMGGAINAAALGHLGLLIGWTDEKVRAMFRARSYLHFLESVGKPTILVSNLLILTRRQALQAFRSPNG
jgi:hypothetical protein